jgi:ankyrin repeat protein
MAALLLSYGANTTASDATWMDKVLHYAACSGDVEIAALLLSRGVDVNVQNPNNGASPLHYAAAAGQLDMIRFLVANGADLNLTDDTGSTPYQLTSRSGAEAGELLQRLAAKQ